MTKHFTQSQLEAIAGAMGDTNDGLTGSEIGHLLASCKMKDPDPALTKRHRLYNALALSQNERQDRLAVLAFIRKTTKPERFARDPERFEPLRANLNLALAFAGLCVTEAGEIESSDKAATLSEAKRRAEELRADLSIRGAHPDVLRFCREELLADNYFHAVLEAVKSVGEKIRAKTGLTDDGGPLIDRALGGTPPMLAINTLLSESEISEQRGFANLVRGAFGMFRNPTAHAARITWDMSKEDAEDLFSIVSLIHRRLDKAVMPPRSWCVPSPISFLTSNLLFRCFRLDKDWPGLPAAQAIAWSGSRHKNRTADLFHLANALGASDEFVVRRRR